MSSRTPTYIPAPNWDIPADSTVVVLGRLIKDAKDPESQVAKSKVVPIAESAVKMGEKTDWRTTLEQVRGGKISLWTKCLQLGPLGGQVGLSRTKSAVEEHQFETLETRAFVPDDDYLGSVLADTTVQAYFEATAWRRPLFIITGLKIARGARAAQEVASKTAVDAAVEADLADLAGTDAPVTIGPGVSWEGSRKMGVSYSGSTDYIFAYRLLRLKPKKGRSGMLSKTYVKGAVFSRDNGAEDSTAGESPRDLFEADEYDAGLGIPDTV